MNCPRILGFVMDIVVSSLGSKAETRLDLSKGGLPIWQNSAKTIGAELALAGRLNCVSIFAIFAFV